MSKSSYLERCIRLINHSVQTTAKIAFQGKFSIQTKSELFLRIWTKGFKIDCINSALVIIGWEDHFGLCPQSSSHTLKEHARNLTFARVLKSSALAFIMVANEKFKFLNIQENWRHLAIKMLLQKKLRYRVDPNYIEFSLIQLRMPVIFTGLWTGSDHNDWEIPTSCGQSSEYHRHP